MGERYTSQPLNNRQFSVNIPKRPQEAAWFTRHPVVIDTNNTVLDWPSEKQHTRAEHLFTAIEQTYDEAGCPVFRWQDETLHPVNDAAANWSTSSDPSHAVVLHPVFMDQVPDRALNVLRLMHAPVMQLFARMKALEPLSHAAMRILADSLPEMEALVKEVGRPIAEQLGLKQKIHPNYVNTFFINTPDTKLRQLPYRGKQVLHQLFMAKFGSFKTTVSPDDQTYNRAMLGSLEGGHPELPPEEIGRRFLLFGSTESAGGYNVVKDRKIAPDDWESSPTVRGIQAMGRFAGKKGLFSPPVEISYFIRNPDLARINAGIARFSRQAEGAIMAYDPRLQVFVMTATGRFGAVKTDLQPDDLLPVLPSEDGQTVDVVPVGDATPKPTSVEAAQLTNPLKELEEQFPLLRLSIENGGYRKSPDGDRAVPIIRAAFHVHRMYEFKNGSPHIIEIHDDHLPVGCGVNLMNQISYNAMHQAMQHYIDQGQQAALAVQYVANHGCDVFVFWKANEDGIIPEDPFHFLKKMVESGELRFRYEIPQV
ncbi:hypothetical protein HY468_01725 [Candidatus Roizmanbacteria bacterium]|nr:hypothetical protein [Candidatus Roizmanbacteria bacterium]